MKYQNLGKSGLKVSEICFGAMSFTGKDGWTHIADTDQKQADQMVKIALDNGINFFDTADVYSAGASKEMLGTALGKRRKDVVIATKCGFRTHPGPNGNGLSRRHIFEACEASLKRLRTDYIDVYQIHAYDFETPLEETLSAFNQLIQDGKVCYIGCSNFSGWQLMKALAIQEKYGWQRFISLQAYYSLVGRDLEWELVPLCRDQGLGILPWSPLQGGFLTGKYRRNLTWPQNTRMKSKDDLQNLNLKKGYDIVEALFSIANQQKVSVAQVALNWLLCKSYISSIVIGARDESQLKENIAASQWRLDMEEMEHLNKISCIQKPYPHWYFNIFRSEQYNKWVNDG